MTFRLKSVDFESRLLNLSKGRASRTSSNYFTIIIGRNGVGKSRLLSEIIRMFKFFDRSKRSWSIPMRHALTGSSHDEFRLHYEMHGSDIELVASQGHLYLLSNESESSLSLYDVPKPKKVIATTVSPFDKFPMDRLSMRSPYERETLTKSTIYRYLGTKNNVGQFSIKTQLSRVIESLIFASSKTKAERLQLEKVFDFLTYQPRIRAEYKLKVGVEIQRNIQRASTKSANTVLRTLVKHIEEVLYQPKHSTLFGVRMRASDKEVPATARMLADALVRLVTQNPAEDQDLTFDLDFQRGEFYRGGLRQYIDVAQLKRFGLASLSDFRLFRRDLPPEGISIRDASSGEQCIVLTILGIASEISDNSLVCIDEPEISLHPEWQERFIELLMRTFSNYSGCHFLLATHSPQILSRIKGPRSFVLTMDDGLLHPASEFSGMSSDYQLVEAFGAPGIRNEYLAREGLAVLTQLSTTGNIDSTNRERFELLLKARPSLSDKDPVAKLIDAIISAEGMTRNDN